MRRVAPLSTSVQNSSSGTRTSPGIVDVPGGGLTLVFDGHVLLQIGNEQHFIIQTRKKICDKKKCRVTFSRRWSGPPRYFWYAISVSSRGFARAGRRRVTDGACRRDHSSTAATVVPPPQVVHAHHVVDGHLGQYAFDLRRHRVPTLGRLLEPALAVARPHPYRQAAQPRLDVHVELVPGEGGRIPPPACAATAATAASPDTCHGQRPCGRGLSVSGSLGGWPAARMAAPTRSVASRIGS